MLPISHSSRRRLAKVALDVLQEAYGQSKAAPLNRTALHRLALGYLLLSGCATKEHTATIWRVLGHEGGFAMMADRQAYFGVTMDGIRQNIDRLSR